MLYFRKARGSRIRYHNLSSQLVNVLLVDQTRPRGPNSRTLHSCLFLSKFLSFLSKFLTFIIEAENGYEMGELQKMRDCLRKVLSVLFSSSQTQDHISHVAHFFFSFFSILVLVPFKLVLNRFTFNCFRGQILLKRVADI